MIRITNVLFFIFICNYGFSQVLDGVVVHYEFENDISDLSGNENDGLATDIQFTSDRLGNEESAILFNGYSSQVEIPIQDLLLNEYTYSLWTKLVVEPPINQTQILLSIGQDGGDQAIALFNQWGSSNNNLRGWYGGGYSTDGTISRILDGEIPQTGEWYHLVLTREFDQLKFYVNCTLIDSLSTGLFAYYGDNSDFLALIGARSSVGASNGYYTGIIDDFRIYNRTLNTTEINELCEYGTVSSANNIEQDEINLYPNPATKTIIIESKQEFEELKLYDLTGALVLEKNNTRGHEYYQLDVNHLDNGIYFLQLKKGINVSKREKVIIIK